MDAAVLTASAAMVAAIFGGVTGTVGVVRQAAAERRAADQTALAGEAKEKADASAIGVDLLRAAVEEHRRIAAAAERRSLNAERRAGEAMERCDRMEQEIRACHQERESLRRELVTIRGRGPG